MSHSSFLYSGAQLQELTAGLHIDPAMKELLEASCTGDARELEILLSDLIYIKVALDLEPQHPNKVRPRRPNIQILLNTAAKSGHLACVQLLLEFGHNHNVSYDTFVSRWEIVAALKSGNNSILKEFIKYWPDVVNLEMGHGGHPLMQTLIKDNFDLSSYLLGNGADVNAMCGPDNYPGSYLKLAAESLQISYTTLLLSHGAQVPQSGAIRTAAEKGRLDVLKLLIEHGGDINERLQPNAGFFMQRKRFQNASETPLYVAAAHGHQDVVEWLLEQGADAKIEALNGKTPLALAREIGNKELVGLFEEDVGEEA